MKRTRTSYTAAFRAEAVALATAEGMTVKSAAAQLAVPNGTLGNWVAAARLAQGAGRMASGRTVWELEQENARLRQALAQARIGRAPGRHGETDPVKPL